jgi:hypothetical protein
MANEFKKECGVGYYWCTTDNVCKPMQKEDGEGAPTNSAGGGQIAGIGVGPKGEPGINKKKGIMPFIGFIRRKKPQ